MKPGVSEGVVKTSSWDSPRHKRGCVSGRGIGWKNGSEPPTDIGSIRTKKETEIAGSR